ncbi:MAG: hypothetical protein H0W06_01450, partial [Chloroflexia bacterium]|nr:hypothetical protein [Chloroflexia bacterium]
MRFTVLAALVAIIFPITTLSTVAHSVAPQNGWAPPATVYLAETGQTLDRLFLDLWREGGGAGAFGYPITPELEQENGHIVQYLQ